MLIVAIVEAIIIVIEIVEARIVGVKVIEVEIIDEVVAIAYKLKSRIIIYLSINEAIVKVAITRNN